MKQGKFYIKIKSIEGLVIFNSLSGFNPSAEESAYKISVHFLSDNKLNPYNLFQLSDSNVKASKQKNGEYQIEWNNIKLIDPESSKLLKEIQIENDIYLASNERALGIGSKCEIKPGQEFLFILENGAGNIQFCYLSLDLRFWHYQRNSQLSENKIIESVEADSAPSTLLATVKSEITLSFIDNQNEFYLPIYTFYDNAIIEDYVITTTKVENTSQFFGFYIGK